MNEKIKVLKAKQERNKKREASIEERDQRLTQEIKTEIGSLAEAIKETTNVEEIAKALQGFQEKISQDLVTNKDEQKALVSQFIKQIERVVKAVNSIQVDTPNVKVNIPKVTNKTVLGKSDVVEIPFGKPVLAVNGNDNRKEVFVHNPSSSPMWFGFTADLSKSTAIGVVLGGQTYIEDVYTGDIYLWADGPNVKATISEVV